MITGIGLDLSLTGSGYSKIVRADDGAEARELQTIKTKPADFINDLERIFYISDTLMEEIPQDTDLVVIEDFFIPSNKNQFNAAISLVKLGLYVRTELYKRNVPFITAVTSQLKKYVKAKAKNFIIKEVFSRWGVEVKDDNQADAYILSRIALECSKYKKDGIIDTNLLKYQQEVIKKIIDERPCYNIEF